MIKFSHKFLVNASIEKVWNFYTTLDHLKIITPKRFNLQIIKSDGEKIGKGKQVYLSGRIFPLFKSKWKSKITFFDDIEHVYIDEMIKGPFKKWVHVHKFVKINDNVTEIIDQIEFQLPLSFFEKIFSTYAKNNLKKVFKNRENETKKFFL